MIRLSIICLVLLTLHAGGCAQKGPGPDTQVAPTASVPEFVDNVRPFLNGSGEEPVQEYVWANNREALRVVFTLDPGVVRREMVRRISDDAYPRRPRNLAAAVLVVRNDDAGRDYFRRQFENLDAHVVDAYWLVGWYGLYGNRETSEYPDMSWAEDLMVAALRDRRTLPRDEIFRRNYSGEQEVVEVRELAVTEGKFPELLARMKSKKALPLLLSLVGENPPYVHHVIAQLGKFGDAGVEPLIMEILKRDDYCFDSAVRAAVDLRMKSAVPVLLQHLRNYDTYYGLNELADASILPVLRRKLPALKPDERAEAQLLILKLQREDPVPALLALLRDHNFPARSEVARRLEELKDKRAVKDLTDVLCTDERDAMRVFALRALAAIRTADAIEGLIKGLEADYSNVRGFKVSPEHDYRGEFQGRISEALKEITGNDFGVDTNEWRKWLAANKGAI